MQSLDKLISLIKKGADNFASFIRQVFDDFFEWLKGLFKSGKADEVFEGDFLAKWEKAVDAGLGGLGFLGGQKLNRARIRFWINDINKISEGRSVLRIAEKGDALFISLKGNRAGFNPFNQKLILQKGMTEYEIFHEYKHLEEFSIIGKDEYIKGMEAIGGSKTENLIRTYKREKYVYNEIMKQSNKFNKNELSHAKGIIDDLIKDGIAKGIDLEKIKI